MKKACGELLRNDSNKARNALDFFGETQYSVAPVQVCYETEGSTVKVPVTGYSISAFRVEK